GTSTGSGTKPGGGSSGSTTSNTSNTSNSSGRHDLGILSRKYEAKGPETVSTGSGDAGGVSYGSYQMASKTGTAAEFVASIKTSYPKIYAALAGKEPGSASFTAAWKELAKQDPDGFFNAQHDFIKATHYDPVVAKIKAATGIDVDARTRTLQDVAWSCSVQHRNGSVNIFKKALNGRSPAAVSDEILIKDIYAERGRRNSSGDLALFSKCSKSVQDGVAKRFENELKDALAALAREKKGGGSSSTTSHNGSNGGTTTGTASTGGKGGGTATGAGAAGASAGGKASTAASDKPKWMDIAMGELGQKEIAGSSSNPRIVEYHASTSLKASSDETAWCSSFVNWCLSRAGVKGTNSAAAASWVTWGNTSATPKNGAIAVIYNASAANSSLSTSGNHVGFLVEETDTHFVLLGGNQSNQVKVSSFAKSKWKLKGYRWPTASQQNGTPPPTTEKKPTTTSSTSSTTKKPTTNASSSSGTKQPTQAPAQPKWLEVARKEVGQKEVSGGGHNARIVEYHAATSLKAKDDETAWCSSFVNWCMKEAGVKGTGSAAAASWASWGTACQAQAGAIAIIYNAGAANSSLSTTGNHVGFLLEETDAHYVILGGNQGDSVKVSSFPKKKWKLKGYRWPAGMTASASTPTTPVVVVQSQSPSSSARPTTADEKKVFSRLDALMTASKGEGSKGAAFSTTVQAFAQALKFRLGAATKGKSLPAELDLVMKALVLWVNDPGDKWGEGVWDSDDLKLSASQYATVPASQYKCNAYVAEAIYLSRGTVFLVHESSSEKGKYFPYQAREWGDEKLTIAKWKVVKPGALGDVWSNGTHTGIYLGEYGGKKLYISARDDGSDVFGTTVQHTHGVQIKYLGDGGVYRRYTP
ncbi:MAG TPA: TIGR02594 family protein, partial [Myxococcaceae bacterium]|nr:TIGR02594 family protein [Myxococcaceae bacterium]